MARVASGRVAHLVTADPDTAPCPVCRVFSQVVRQRSTTAPRDLGYGEDPLTVRRHKRRYRCVENACPRKALTECIPELPAGRPGRGPTAVGCSAVMNGSPAGVHPDVERPASTHEPTDQLLTAWIAKEELRALLASTRGGVPPRHRPPADPLLHLVRRPRRHPRTDHPRRDRRSLVAGDPSTSFRPGVVERVAFILHPLLVFRLSALSVVGSSACVGRILPGGSDIFSALSLRLPCWRPSWRW